MTELCRSLLSGRIHTCFTHSSLTDALSPIEHSVCTRYSSWMSTYSAYVWWVDCYTCGNVKVTRTKYCAAAAAPGSPGMCKLYFRFLFTTPFASTISSPSLKTARNTFFHFQSRIPHLVTASKFNSWHNLPPSINPPSIVLSSDSFFTNSQFDVRSIRVTWTGPLV